MFSLRAFALAFHIFDVGPSRHCRGAGPAPDESGGAAFQEPPPPRRPPRSTCRAGRRRQAAARRQRGRPGRRAAAGPAGDLGRQPDPGQAVHLRRRPRASSRTTATTARAPSPTRSTAPACSSRRWTPASFMRWGERGKGQWITVYTNPGHAYAVIAGLRLDTSWPAAARSTSASSRRPTSAARAGARPSAPRAATSAAIPSVSNRRVG